MGTSSWLRASLFSGNLSPSAAWGGTAWEVPFRAFPRRQQCKPLVQCWDLNWSQQWGSLKYWENVRGVNLLLFYVAANAISRQDQILTTLLILTFWLWLKWVTQYVMFDLHENWVPSLICNTNPLLALLWCFAITNVTAELWKVADVWIWVQYSGLERKICLGLWSSNLSAHLR